MLKVKLTEKLTLASLKSFAKRNAENLYAKENSSFDGMTDMVERNREAKWRKVPLDKAYGHEGVYLVGSSRDRFGWYEDDQYIGISVYNCCGDGILATKKKSEACSQILQLMDNDYTYSESVKLALKENRKLNRELLESELNAYV